ncbi:MAG: CoA pyrophosphatase [Bacteroidia bacterium]
MDSEQDFINQLKSKLNDLLPGAHAQNAMSSRARLSVEDYLRDNPQHKKSAVILPVFRKAEIFYTALIKRPVYDGVHSGQLALPGGKYEEQDESIEYTALREFEEEVGIRLHASQLIGKLSPVYIPVSNYLVQPFVAYLDHSPQWLANPDEVHSILEFPVHTILNPEIKSRKRIEVGKNRFVDAPCYIIQGDILWGATAMMFAEFEHILRK